MEVHAHTHTERKTFTHYLWEFLMLFLAVFCGFLAENQREHMVELRREKEYMISLIRDLQADIKEAAESKEGKISHIEMADSVFLLFNEGDYEHKSGDLYYLCRSLAGRTFFHQNDGTIQQLKNAGGLRLIRKNNVADSIQVYINQTRNVEELQELLESQIIDYRRSLNTVFDAQEFNKMFASKSKWSLARPINNPPMFSVDKKDVNDVCMRLLVVKGNQISQIGSLDNMINYAKMLLQLIKEEYHLK